MEQLDFISHGILIGLCAATLVVLALCLYLLWLCLRLHREVRRYLRRPEIERDANGRRIKERV